jgi:hypothetical protein
MISPPLSLGRPHLEGWWGRRPTSLAAPPLRAGGAGAPPPLGFGWPTSLWVPRWGPHEGVVHQN